MISRLKHRVADIEVALRTTDVKKQRITCAFICSITLKRAAYFDLLQRFHRCVADNHCCISKVLSIYKKIIKRLQRATFIMILEFFVRDLIFY